MAKISARALPQTPELDLRGPTYKGRGRERKGRRGEGEGREEEGMEWREESGCSTCLPPRFDNPGYGPGLGVYLVLQFPI